MDILEGLPIPENSIFHIQYEASVFVTRPQRLDRLPTIESNCEQLKILGKDICQKYFQALFNSDIRVRFINHVDVNEADCIACLQCDRCVGDELYFCTHCFKHWCENCLPLECQGSSKRLKISNAEDFGLGIECDYCRKEIKRNTNYYTNGD